MVRTTVNLLSHPDPTDPHKRIHDDCNHPIWTMDGLDYCQGCGMIGITPDAVS